MVLTEDSANILHRFKPLILLIASIIYLNFLEHYKELELELRASGKYQFAESHSVKEQKSVALFSVQKTSM